MNKDLKLSIIIVNYNTPDLVYDCLRSIKKQITRPCELVLVENGSARGKKLSKDKVILALGIQSVESRTFNFKLLTFSSNLGFGGGNNAGAKLAKGEYLLLLNPDTLVIDNSVSKMVDFLDKNKHIGAVTPFLYQKDGKMLQRDFYGHFQSLSTLIFHRNSPTPKLSGSAKPSLDGCNSETLYADRISAAALMIRSDLFNKLKGFDEKIFMYMEDDDLCKRIISLGYKNAVLTTAKIIHLEGQATTSREKKRLYYKSQSYFWRKHNGLLPTLLMQIIRWPYKTFKTKF